MRDFLEWVFDYKTPFAVTLFAVVCFFVAFLTWILAVGYFESLALFLAPFVFGAYACIQEYKRHKEGGK